MNFIELAKTRYSVRSFSKKQIETEKVNLILEAGKVAPTACNLQPQKIYVLQSEDSINKLSEVCKCIFGAPTVLLITAEQSKAWKNPFSDNYNTIDIDCSIVNTHMMLQAWELGIGTCWVGFFDLAKVAEHMELPKDEKIIAILPMGYPSDNAKPMPAHFQRNELAQTVKYL